MTIITGATRVAGLIGDPVRFSKSPVLHAAACASLGIDATYVAFPVERDVATAVESVRALGLLGVSVTMPYKELVIPYLDRVDESALRLRAVNTIVPEGSELVGYNTDGIGLVRALRADLGFEVAGQTVSVLGAGGAARAAIAAFGDAGARRIHVINRNPERALEASVLGGSAGAVASDIPAALADSSLVVNATSVGMEGTPGTPIDAGQIPPSALVVDLIYAPHETALLAAAREAGSQTANGIGMLIHQAAEQVRLWTGLVPDPSIMRQALQSQ